jgi:hypothetical protein
MPSSTSSFERVIPDLPWRQLALAAALLTAVAAAAWEIRARACGYAPTLNDTPDLWADWREQVRPDSLVVIGDSRALFDTDLDALEQGLGRRPVQLALVGSCAYPILENLANDQSFHGTVISSLIPLMWLAPPPAPPYQNSVKALKRFQTRTVAQRASHHLGMFLEEHVAFLKQEDLTLAQLLKRVKLPGRASFHAPPNHPPYFQTTARDRRTRMTESCAQPGPLQQQVKSVWLSLFTPPPPPSYVPPEAFAKGMGEAIEKRFADTAAAVKKIRARGGKVVFVRYPVAGPLKAHEDKLTPRAGPWTRIIKESGAAGIYFEDYPELASFDCPEWSHLSGPDSVEFTKRLVPHLKKVLAP